LYISALSLGQHLQEMPQPRLAGSSQCHRGQGSLGKCDHGMKRFYQRNDRLDDERETNPSEDQRRRRHASPLSRSCERQDSTITQLFLQKDKAADGSGKPGALSVIGQMMEQFFLGQPEYSFNTCSGSGACGACRSASLGAAGAQQGLCHGLRWRIRSKIFIAAWRHPFATCSSFALRTGESFERTDW